MHIGMGKALKKALEELDVLGDRAIKKHLLGLEDGLEEGMEDEALDGDSLEGPEVVEVSVQKLGAKSDPELEVVEGLDGAPTLDETTVTDEEEVVGEELLEKLKMLLEE